MNLDDDVGAAHAGLISYTKFQAPGADRLEAGKNERTV
jgi:hypothetical protein